MCVQWHCANLEYCVNTDLRNLSLLQWDQVRVRVRVKVKVRIRVRLRVRDRAISCTAHGQTLLGCVIT